jgi:hypothetical protein
MVFVLSLAVLHAIVVVQLFRTLVLIQEGALKRREGMLTAFGMMAAVTLISFPLADEFLTLVAFSHGAPIAPQRDYQPLWFLGLGGVLALVVFCFRLHRQRRNPNAGFYAVGANALGMMVGLYMLFVVADQVAFFVPSREDAGMLNWGMFRGKGVDPDIQCQSDILVVKGLDSDAATYRCPHEGLVVMGRFSGTPIVPWPSYSEGISNKLAAEMRKIKLDAVNIKVEGNP